MNTTLERNVSRKPKTRKRTKHDCRPQQFVLWPIVGSQPLYSPIVQLRSGWLGLDECSTFFTPLPSTAATAAGTATATAAAAAAAAAAAIFAPAAGGNPVGKSVCKRRITKVPAQLGVRPNPNQWIQLVVTGKIGRTDANQFSVESEEDFAGV